MKKSLVLAFIFTFFSAFIAFTFFEIIFDDSYDAFVSNLGRGQFTPFSFMDQHYLAGILVRDVQKWLQNLFPHLSIFPITYVLANIASEWLFLFTIHHLFLKNKAKWVQYLVLLAFSLIFIENIVSITHTRFATIFCGIALWNLYELNKKKVLSIFWILIYLFGFLMRPESGIGAMILFIIAIIPFHLNFYRSFKALQFPLLFFIILSSVFFIHKNFTQRFEIKIEPDIEYALSTQRLVPIQNFAEPLDQLRYEMAVNAVFIDTQFVNIQFLEKMISNQFAIQKEKLVDSFFNISHFYQFYSFTAFLWIVFLVLATFNANSFAQTAKYWVYCFLINGIFIYLDYHVNLAERHFLSLQLIAILPILPIIINKHSIPKWFHFITLVGFLLTSIYSTKIALQNQVEIAQDVTYIEEQMQLFEEQFQGEIVVITVDSYHLLDHKFSIYNEKYSKNTYLLYDAVNYSLVPRNLSYLSKVCSCKASNPLEFLTWCAKLDALFLIEKNRSQLIEKYLALVHKENVSFQLNEQFKKTANFDSLSIPNFQVLTLTIKED